MEFVLLNDIEKYTGLCYRFRKDDGDLGSLGL